MLDLMTKDKIIKGELIQIFPDSNFPAQPISLLWNNNHYQSNKHSAFKTYFSDALIG
jgi:DNA-binding transcriptional LysR family regulator